MEKETLKSLDLFRDCTPGGIAVLASYMPGRGSWTQTEEGRRKISESHIGRSWGAHSEEAKKRISLANLGKTLSEETRRKRSNANLGKSRGPLSLEHRKKISRALMGKNQGPRRPHSEETKKRMSEAHTGNKNAFWGKSHSLKSRRMISEAALAQWARYSPKEKEYHLLNSFHSDEARRKAEATKAKFQEEINRRISETKRTNWENMSRDEKDRICLSIVKSLHIRPNEAEKAVDRYLQKEYPGEWAYNGDYSQGVSIGRRIPDFVNINGRKEVISVMGCLGLYHFLEDEGKEIEHYAKYGFKCTVIWEWDCWDPDILSTLLGGKH